MNIPETARLANGHLNKCLPSRGLRRGHFAWPYESTQVPSARDTRSSRSQYIEREGSEGRLGLELPNRMVSGDTEDAEDDPPTRWSYKFGENISCFTTAGTGGVRVYAGPLRLLAYEVFTRLNAKGLKCDLVTGDEMQVSDDGEARMTSCTVEMVPQGRLVDVAVIDEIQMLGNKQRGWAWTQALLGVRAKEVHLCGEERAVPCCESWQSQWVIDSRSTTTSG